MKRKVNKCSAILVFLFTLCLCSLNYAAESQELSTEEEAAVILKEERKGEETVEIVDKIDINTEEASVRFIRNEYIPDEYFLFGNNPGMRMFLVFEYTNKRSKEAGVCTDFDIKISQNEKELDRVQVFDGDADLTAILNCTRNDVVNETIPVYIPVVLNDYSPITIMISAISIDLNVIQMMEITVEPPEDVIVPNNKIAEPDEFVTTWINTINGDLLELFKGDVDPKTGVVKGRTDYTPANWALSSWPSGFSYTIDGDILTLDKERFRVVKENDKLYLNSLDTDTRYIRKNDFLKFEDIEVHTIGEKISTDKIELTLNGYSYMDEIDPGSLGGNASLFHKEMFVPDNGMIWAKVAYNLFCTSDQEISMQSIDNNIRFTVVYQKQYLFEMNKFTNNYITKGHGSDEHVEYLGSFSKKLTIQPLVSEDFDTWVPVAPAVRDDLEGAHHILVYLPTSTGTQIFVYDLSGSAIEKGADAGTRFDGEDGTDESYSAGDLKNQIRGEAQGSVDSKTEVSVEDVDAAIASLEVSDKNLYDIIAVKKLVDALPEGEREKLSDQKKLEEAEALLRGCYISEFDKLNALLEEAESALDIENKDGVTGRRALSEAVQIADELVKFGYQFTEEDAKKAHENYENLKDIFYEGTGIVKLDYLAGADLSEYGHVVDDDPEFGNCYGYWYLIDAAEHGNGDQGVAFCKTCLESMRTYLQEHFTYVDSGMTDKNYECEHYKDDTDSDIYLYHYTLDVRNYYASFIKLAYSKRIADEGLHEFTGTTLLGRTPVRYAENGDTVSLGRYEQDGNSENGAETIAWTVLDATEDEVLVMSEKVLDVRKFNEDRVDTTWEDSTIRAWLNSEFVDLAFTEGEQTLLCSKTVKADANPFYQTSAGNDTEDRVFLPSASEVLRLFPDPESRICVPTAYAKSVGSDPDEAGHVSWLMRTPGKAGMTICFTSRNLGYILGIGDYEISLKSAYEGGYVDAAGSGVRPMMWLSRSYKDEDLVTEAVMTDMQIAVDGGQVGAGQTEDKEVEQTDSAEARVTKTIYTDADTIQKVQTALNAAGYDCGTPDGIAGNKTKTAISSYQTAQGMNATGDVDDALLGSLQLQ